MTPPTDSGNCRLPDGKTHKTLQCALHARDMIAALASVAGYQGIQRFAATNSLKDTATHHRMPRMNSISHFSGCS